VTFAENTPAQGIGTLCDQKRSDISRLAYSHRNLSRDDRTTKKKKTLFCLFQVSAPSISIWIVGRLNLRYFSPWYALCRNESSCLGLYKIHNISPRRTNRQWPLTMYQLIIRGDYKFHEDSSKGNLIQYRASHWYVRVTGLLLAKLSGHCNGAAILSTVMYAQYNDTQDGTGVWLSRRNARKVVAMSHDDAYRMHSRLFAWRVNPRRCISRVWIL